LFLLFPTGEANKYLWVVEEKRMKKSSEELENFLALLEERDVNPEPVLALLSERDALVAEEWTVTDMSRREARVSEEQA
jgi:hypothetical protein